MCVCRAKDKYQNKNNKITQSYLWSHSTDSYYHQVMLVNVWLIICALAIHFCCFGVGIYVVQSSLNKNAIIKIKREKKEKKKRE